MTVNPATEAHLACANIVAAFNHHVDTGRASLNTQLFVPHGVLELPAARHSGPEIERAMVRRESDTARRTCHHTSNFQFLGTDGTTANAVSTVILYVLPHGDEPLHPTAILRNDDEFERTAGGTWLLRHRCTTKVWPVG